MLCCLSATVITNNLTKGNGPFWLTTPVVSAGTFGSFHFGMGQAENITEALGRTKPPTWGLESEDEDQSVNRINLKTEKKRKEKNNQYYFHAFAAVAKAVNTNLGKSSFKKIQNVRF